MMPFNGDAPDESGAARKPKPLNTCARCGVQIARPKKRCMPCWDIVRSERASVYARAFVRAFHGRDDEEVPSPTFTLVQTYGGPRGELWHVDAYRLKDPDEILELGLDDAFPDGILLIEWPERLGPHLPRRRLDLTLANGPTETARLAVLEDRGGDDWCRRLVESESQS